MSWWVSISSGLLKGHGNDINSIRVCMMEMAYVGKLIFHVNEIKVFMLFWFRPW